MKAHIINHHHHHLLFALFNPRVSPQSSVTCHEEYRRHGIEAQFSFHHAEHGGFVEYLSE